MKSSNHLKFCTDCKKEISIKDDFVYCGRCKECDESIFSEFIDALSNGKKSSNDLKVEQVNA